MWAEKESNELGPVFDLQTIFPSLGASLAKAPPGSTVLAT